MVPPRVAEVGTRSATSSWGRGEDDQKVRQRLATAATVPGFIGFPAGRTSFWEPLVRSEPKR
jgi:hypothetical protein